jgi:hypothetical protein
MPRPLRILDLGGTIAFWNSVDYARLGNVEVTMLNLLAQEDLLLGFRADIGDARSLKHYDARNYDLVFSNSCIGHVGTWDDQRRMTEEIRRVGKRYFIQTPNHYFPIDWRTGLPLFHFMPELLQSCGVYLFPIAHCGRLGWDEARTWPRWVRNLKRREVETLFPEARIVRERFGWLTKSFVAIWR